MRNGLLLSYLMPGFQKVWDGSTLMRVPAPVPRGDPWGYNVGLQQCIACKLIQAWECLKSCAVCDLIPTDKHVSLQMASTCCLDTTDTACDRPGAGQTLLPKLDDGCCLCMHRHWYMAKVASSSTTGVWPLAHVPQLLSPATGFRLTAAAVHAIGLHVPPPSLLPLSGVQGIGLAPPPRRQLDASFDADACLGAEVFALRWQVLCCPQHAVLAWPNWDNSNY